MNRKRYLIFVLTLFLLLIVSFMISIFAGRAIHIDILSLLHFRINLTPVERDILFNIRIPRALMACMIGASLAVTGASLQFFFRNPLCTPFTLGVSGGAALGAVIGLKLHIYNTFLGSPGVYILSLAVSFITMVTVYSIARRKCGGFTETLLLSGVIVNFFLSSLIMFIEYLSAFEESFEIIAWLMGSLQVTGYKILKYSFFCMIPGWFLLFLSIKWFNLLSLGEDIARTSGADIESIKRRIYFSTSLLTGVSVTVAGPIGFVGLIVPHILRLIIGADARFIIPGSFLLGASFLLLSDLLARSLIAPSEIPVGILTAITGGPFFLFLLLKGGKGGLE